MNRRIQNKMVKINLKQLTMHTELWAYSIDGRTASFLGKLKRYEKFANYVANNRANLIWWRKTMRPIIREMQK